MIYSEVVDDIPKVGRWNYWCGNNKGYPLNKMTIVEVEYQNGIQETGSVDQFNWARYVSNEIKKYRRIL